MPKQKKKKPGLLQRLALRYLRRSAGFKAAENDRLKLSWNARANAMSANELIFRDLPTLVSRAREQSINNPYAKRFYTLLKTKVIGPRGPRHQNLARLPSGVPDKGTNALIEEGWKGWVMQGVCDVTGRYSLIRFLHLWIETLARDGEVLVREVFGFENKCGYALQILEADRLDRKLNAELNNGNIIRMGVEFNEWERPVAYYLLVQHPGDRYQSIGGQQYERIPADELIHTLDPWRPHQARGFPWLHASMVDLHHVGEYRESEMIAAEFGAKNIGFYKQNPDAISEPETDDGELIEELEAGTAQLLPYGIDWVEGLSNHPNANFGDFIRNSLRGVSSGSGISYPRLANDGAEMSWSSLRDTELDDRDLYRLLQGLFIDGLMIRIRTNWLKMAILNGVLPLRFSDFDRINKPHFQARGWQWVSPRDEAVANEKSIKSRTDSRSNVIRSRGEDPEELFDEIAWEEEILGQKGLLKAEQNTGDDKEKTDDDDDSTDKSDDTKNDS
ncbi:MAG: phage portal protein [Candidatus Thiodiazotropha sp. (ex Epidulcina cf. delphinae)]|nr:phage portal protein [Candidatus Thiodiazotropha sp. (ex Epidulcina cf. delphinae)]